MYPDLKFSYIDKHSQLFNHHFLPKFSITKNNKTPTKNLNWNTYSKNIFRVYNPTVHHAYPTAPNTCPTPSTMEEEIDVETVEKEDIPAADWLKLNLQSESTPSCSYSSSYTNLEPIRANSPNTEPSSSKAPSEISSSIPEQLEYRSSDEDNELSPFTPRSRLRQIEEHGQYDSSRDHDRKFKCQYCHKRFVRKEEKLRHERSHTNDRKYKCRSKFSGKNFKIGQY
jgi:hypothetical protein